MRPAYSGLRRANKNPVVCGRRFCSHCGRWRHVCDFGIEHARGRDRLRSWCFACSRIVCREMRRRRTPRQKELNREYQRIWAEVRRRRAGIPPRNWRTPRPLPNSDEGRFFDATPLVAELRRTDISQWALAELAGVPPRAIYRITSGEVQHVQLDTADRLALALDRSLAELWGVDD